jgi:small subunit ribosomal protein S16
MVVIRLARGGCSHNPQYRITVADSRRAAKGKFLEVLGTYNPSARGKAQGLIFDVEKAKDWIKKGAQPTKRVQFLIKKATSAQA